MGVADNEERRSAFFNNRNAEYCCTRCGYGPFPGWIWCGKASKIIPAGEWPLCHTCYQRIRRENLRRDRDRADQTCVCCGHMFQARGDAKFCSGKCRQQSYRHRVAERILE
jgi:hypothetical protein